MNSLVNTFFVAFVASLLLTVAVRAIARRWDVVDYPDGKRKLHRAPVALWGGVAVYLSVVLGLVVACQGTFGAGRGLTELSTALVLAAGIVCFFGALDDCYCLHPRFKLLLQVGAVLPIVTLGFSIDRIVAFGRPIELGWLGVPLTVAWLVGCINALNLLDGMDGLASLVGLLTAAMMGLIANSMGNAHVAVIAVVLAGALAGFLVHNFPPASIFLGDSGSMVIGLVLGVLGIQGAMKTSATLAITIPTVVMTLPIFDTLLALVRRKLTGRAFDSADREHIHHRLLDRGLTQWQTLCVIGALCLATGGAATAATIFRNDALAWITALTLMALAVRTRLFGHHELALVKQAVTRGMTALARQLGAWLPGLGFGAKTGAGQPSLDDAWSRLIEGARAWQACRVDLTVVREGEFLRRYAWVDPAIGPQEPSRWSLALSFRQRDGCFCELQAGGLELPEPQPTARAGLARVLEAFAADIAGRGDQPPHWTMVVETHTAVDAAPHRRKAA